MTDASFIAALRRAAAERTGAAALIELDSTGAEAARLTFGELWDTVRRAAVAIACEVSPGGRVLVSCRPGVGYAVSVLGAMTAGRVPVPTYAADSPQDARSPGVLRVIARQSGAEAMIIDGPVMGETGRDVGSQNGDRLDLPRSLVLTLDADGEDAVAVTDQSATAFLQYTSGSTATPRGVIVTQRALLENSKTIARSVNLRPGGVAVTWLPPYHDMGMVGGLLAPLAAGATVVVMAPESFLRRPVRWLQAISRYGACLSAAPNFAYDLCVRRISPSEYHDLALGSWTSAVNGAEPVRDLTMRRFYEKFASVGFRADAFRPSYGLAEATLLVTTAQWCHRRSAASRYNRLGSVPVSRNEAATQANDAVSVGRPPQGVVVAVVDPDTLAEVADGEIGEVWIAGDCVASGYFQDDDATAERFGHSLPGHEAAFVRSGDLGVMRDGELAIVGRVKNVLRVRGNDCVAESIESAIRDSCLEVRGCAVVTVDKAERVRAVALCEAHVDSGRMTELGASVRRAVIQHCGLWLDDVLIVEPGVLPKTSSGKVRHGECVDLAR